MAVSPAGPYSQAQASAPPARRAAGRQPPGDPHAGTPNLLTRASALVAGPGLALPALAQPAGTAVIWSGFPAGGLGDQVTRPLLDRLRGKYPANFVLDSKPGAGARIAVNFVKRANADGNTLLQTPSSPMTLYPHLYKKLSYDPLADFAEQGFKDIVFIEWLGWFAPARTPADLVARLNAAVREAMAGPEMVEVVQKLGLRACSASPAEFAAMVKADLDRWAPVIKATGFTAEE